MGNLNVAIIAANDYAKALGKKGTASDITLYDIKKGHDTVSLIEPTKYPERLASLFYACSMANAAMVVVDEVNANLGESILMLNCLGVAKGWFVLRNYITPDRIQPLVKGTSLEGYSFLEDDTVKLREMLLDEAAKQAPVDASSPGIVPIDHHFNVKGVGTVILGYVARGTVNRHDVVNVLPTKKQAQVRSIQKHDDDYDTAEPGDRVGLALKNIEADELDRGFVLTTDPKVKCEKAIEAQAELIKYWPTPLKEGMVLHIGHWMQYQPSRVESVDNGGDWRRPKLRITMDKELVYLPGSKAVLTQLEGGKLRIVGSLTLP
ncbi:MAG: Elongation factor 1-alpha [Methanomassiliicoccales archaeon PtaU1.Bin124]|nr:MAG: Elongation factor 1-alpha [Methanomassiliicoccales archaeon PtaU1.Bin124]